MQSAAGKRAIIGDAAERTDSVSTKNLGMVSLLAFGVVCGCSSNAGTGSDNQNANGGPSPYTPGCTVAPACGSCGTCAEQCYCVVQNIVTCSNICSEQMNGGGAAGASFGAGGAVGASGSTSLGGAPVGAGGFSAGSGGYSPVGAGGSVPGGGGTSPGAGGTDPGAGGAAPGAGGATQTPQTSEFDISSVQFPVGPGGEVFKCQNFANPVKQDVAILYSDSFMAPGSHHMFVFHDPSFNADSNAVADCSGVEFRDFIHEAQTPQREWKYPDGVGRSLKGTDGLRILVHYLNTSSQMLTGQVAVKFHYVAPSQVQFLAAEMFLNTVGLAVVPGTSTVSRTYRIPYDITMIQAVSHMHKQGVHFTATTTAGQTLYDGTQWDEPQPNYFNPPMPVAANTTLTWSCTYNNQTGTTLTFGESAATNEMCIFVGCFYPTNPAANQGVSINVQSF